MLAVNIGYLPRHAGPAQGSRPPRRPRLRATLLLLGALALVCAGATVTVLRVIRHPLPCGRGSCAAPDAGPAWPAPRAVVHSDPRLGLNGPTGAAYAAGRIWVANYADNSVSEFGWRSAADAAVHSGPAYMFAEPSAIISGRRHVWIANTLANSVTELNADNGSVVRTIAVVAAPRALALSGGRLWVADAGSVSEFSVGTGRLLREITGDKFADPDALAVSNGMLWIANGHTGTVTVLNATTGAWRATLRGPRLALPEPVAEVASRTRLWVASEATRSITEISTISLGVVRRIAGRAYRFDGPTAMVLARGGLWVANTYGNSVTEIDASTGRLVRVLSGAPYGFDHPEGLAAHHGVIWVTNNDRGSVTELRVPRRGAARARPAHPSGSRG